MTDRARLVMVVDDQPDTTAIVSVLLATLGYDAYSALRGRDAIRLARELDPGIVLLDIGLPDLSGYDVARALRADHGRRRYIAAFSAHQQPRDVERAVQAGFDEYLVKPVDLACLKRLLRTAASRAALPPC